MGAATHPRIARGPASSRFAAPFIFPLPTHSIVHPPPAPSMLPLLHRCLQDAALRIDPAMRPLWRRNVLLVGDSVGDATMAREIGEPIPIGASVPSSPAGSSPASTPLPDSDAAVGVGGAGAMPVARAEGTAGAGAMPSLASAATTAASTAGKHASPSAGHAAVLRVGIINDGDALEALRPKYRPAFDVLLERDPPLHVLVDLLRALPKAANAPLSA